jgi:hypothetical protein
MATDETENNREQSIVLLGDLYSVGMKLVQSEMPRSRYRAFERLETSRRTKQQGEIYKTDFVQKQFNV